MGYSRELPLQSLRKHYHVRRSCFQSARIHYATLFATGNNVEGLKLVKFTSQSTGIIMLETCLLLDRRTATEWILNSTVHRLCNTFCNPSLLPLDGQKYCAIITAQYNWPSRRNLCTCEVLTAVVFLFSVKQLRRAWIFYYSLSLEKKELRSFETLVFVH